jgi:hypothetical protein
MNTGCEDRAATNTAVMKKYFDLDTARRVTGQKN